MEKPHALSAFFEQSLPRLNALAGRLCDDPAAVVDEAREIFAGMVPRMGYVDNPQHPLATALFVPATNIALFLALAKRGVDVHRFGRSMLEGLKRAPIPLPPARLDAQARAAFKAAADASLADPRPGEDVFEVVEPGSTEPGDEPAFEWGFNVKSCAICQLAAQYDAMSLVPYFCAVDDVISRRAGQGLRRTGSIAVGASHCDFRYAPDAEPQPLAPRHPDKIRG